MFHIYLWPSAGLANTTELLSVSGSNSIKINHENKVKHCKFIFSFLSITKNAFLKYQTLDRCFKNNGRNYLIADLLEEVNTALFDDNPSNNGIQIRQLRDDIKFMKSEAGFNAPIESRVIDGKKHAYFYIDPNFSISNMPINETELLQFKNALTLLSRFEGSPGFEWISEVSVILKDSFGLKTNNEKVISFERNLDYTGENFITLLFNAIVNKRVLSIILFQQLE